MSDSIHTSSAQARSSASQTLACTHLVVETRRNLTLLPLILRTISLKDTKHRTLTNKSDLCTCRNYRKKCHTGTAENGEPERRRWNGSRRDRNRLFYQVTAVGGGATVDTALRRRLLKTTQSV